MLRKRCRSRRLVQFEIVVNKVVQDNDNNLLESCGKRRVEKKKGIKEKVGGEFRSVERVIVCSEDYENSYKKF